MSAGNSTPGFMPRPHCRECTALTMLVLSMLYLAMAGCATWQVPAEVNDSALRARAKKQELRGVKLSAAVLSTDDSQRMFGADINSTGVQPVWIEVENTTSQVLWLLRSGTDPDLFSPLEVAWSFHASFAGETNAHLDDHFNALSFQNPISPGATHSGVIFTNPHKGTRLLSIDILGQGELFAFTLFPPVPDDQTDASMKIANVRQLIEAAVDDYRDSDDFRAMLEQLPCCALSADGSEAGDPLNVVMVGKFNDIAAALIRRGLRANRLDVDNSQRLFDRPPDIVGRKTGHADVATNWLRIWVAPLRYQGQPVFLAQTGRRQGWRSQEGDEEELVLHPNIDEVRNLLIQDMMYSSGLGKLAFVSGVGTTSPGGSRDSPGGASYHTDGLRAVLFFVTRPRSLSGLEILDWHPYLKLIEAEAVKEKENAEN